MGGFCGCLPCDALRCYCQTEPNPETRKLWEFLAEEQNKHYMALDEMVQFVLVTDVWFHGLAW